MFKVNNRNTITTCEICSKLTIKTSKPRHWRRSVVFLVNFEHISLLFLVFLLLTLSRLMPTGIKLYETHYREHCYTRKLKAFSFTLIFDCVTGSDLQIPMENAIIRQQQNSHYYWKRKTSKCIIKGKAVIKVIKCSQILFNKEKPDEIC